MFFLEGRQQTDFFFVEADLAFGGVTDLASGEGLFDLFFCFLFGFNCSHFFWHFKTAGFSGGIHKYDDNLVFWLPQSILCLQPKVPNVKALVVPMHLSLMEVDGWVESPAQGRVFNEWKLPPLVRQSTV